MVHEKADVHHLTILVTTISTVVTTHVTMVTVNVTVSAVAGAVNPATVPPSMDEQLMRSPKAVDARAPTPLRSICHLLYSSNWYVIQELRTAATPTPNTVQPTSNAPVKERCGFVEVYIMIPPP
eukprot:sb/3475765/